MKQFSLLIKPSGSDCNVDCKYCFYKCRAPEVGQGRQRMSCEVLEKLIKDYMGLGFNVSSYAWQGGEPTLMGLEFYERAVHLQKQYGKAGTQVSNGFQTNGILLDDDWCEFFVRNKFLVGISIDGPKRYHDHYRVNLGGQGTFDQVIKSIECCKKHGVDFNLLTLINDRNVEVPDELFDFLAGLGTDYLQFIPCVELNPKTHEISEFAVTPKKWGEFLCRIFDKWLKYGPAKLSIREFDSILAYYVNGVHSVCTFGRQCADYIVIEHNGDVFCCDFFVEADWRIGNIFETPIDELANSEKKKKFARIKGKLCNKCLICRHLAMCRGGCLKDRKVFSGEFDRESYLCEAYKRFFQHSLGKFMELAANVQAGKFNR